MASKSVLVSIFSSTKQVDVAFRKETVKKYVEEGNTKAEAERLMYLELFKKEARILLQLKKIPLSRLHDALDEIMVEDVMES